MQASCFYAPTVTVIQTPLHCRVVHGYINVAVGTWLTTRDPSCSLKSGSYYTAEGSSKAHPTQVMSFPPPLPNHATTTARGVDKCLHFSNMIAFYASTASGGSMEKAGAISDAL